MIIDTEVRHPLSIWTEKTLKLRSAELRQKIPEAILSSNLSQQCFSKTFAEDSILNPDNHFVIYLGILWKINNCIDKNQVTFLSPRLVFLTMVTCPQET